MGRGRRGAPARALPEAWYVWLRHGETPSPNPGPPRLDRELFEGADVHANVVEEPEERSQSGSTWTLTIRQRGVITTVEVYV
ncbi:MAG: hypothetical protein QOC78_1786 [Solirubrobacteraceae bacterium]|nr:hypothetical protein [Solirubrobacteraceae bacterium]